MAEFFTADVVTYDIGQLIGDPYDSDYLQYDSDDYDSDDYDSVDNRIARVENAIENAIAAHRRIEHRRNEDDLGIERMFLDEAELEYARWQRLRERNQYIKRSVYYATDINIWYTNGHFFWTYNPRFYFRLKMTYIV